MKKKKKKKRTKHDNWYLLKRSQYSLYIFTYFCYKKVTASSKTIFASQSSNCLTNLLATLVHPTPQ